MNNLTSDIDRYTEWTRTVWMESGKGFFGDIAICALGLGGESGETTEVVKKYLRDGVLDREKLIKELGDVIYYWARLCDTFEICPSAVIRANIEKLTSRQARGVSHGAGDDR